MVSPLGIGDRYRGLGSRGGQTKGHLRGAELLVRCTIIAQATVGDHGHAVDVEVTVQQVLRNHTI